MPHADARIQAIYRYPVKGLSPQPLAQVRLTPGQTLPADRLYAIENGPTGFDPAAPAYFPKQRFLMLMRNERLAALRTDFDEASHTLSIQWEGREAARGDLRTKAGRLAIEAFFRRFMPKELRGPPKVLSGGGHSFSDVAKPRSCRSSISPRWRRSRPPSARPCIRCASAAISTWPAGRPGTNSTCSAARSRIGGARLKVVKRIQRCAATDVDPDTGMRDLAIPQTLVAEFRPQRLRRLCAGR